MRFGRLDRMLGFGATWPFVRRLVTVGKSTPSRPFAPCDTHGRRRTDATALPGWVRARFTKLVGQPPRRAGSPSVRQADANCNPVHTRFAEQLLAWTIERTNSERAMDMKRVMEVTAGAVLCLALTSYWGAATAQQPIAPEAVRPPICDGFDVDGRASAPLRDVTLPPSESCAQLHPWRGQPNIDGSGA